MNQVYYPGYALHIYKPKFIDKIMIFLKIFALFE